MVAFENTILFKFIAMITINVTLVECSRYRPGVAQRVGRGVDLLFHDNGTRKL